MVFVFIAGHECMAEQNENHAVTFYGESRTIQYYFQFKDAILFSKQVLYNGTNKYTYFFLFLVARMTWHLIFCQRTSASHSSGLNQDESCHSNKRVQRFHLHQSQDLSPYTISANLDLIRNHSRRWFSEFARNRGICLVHIAI